MLGTPSKQPSAAAADQRSSSRDARASALGIDLLPNLPRPGRPPGAAGRLTGPVMLNSASLGSVCPLGRSGIAQVALYGPGRAAPPKLHSILQSQTKYRRYPHNLSR